MLFLEDRGYPLCDGLTRRQWLGVGSLGLLGLSMPDLLHGREVVGRPSQAVRTAWEGRPTFGKAKSCIVLFFLGGPPQHETWDPKPDAPAEIRGDLKSIPSAVPGLWVGELMPRVARCED